MPFDWCDLVPTAYGACTYSASIVPKKRFSDGGRYMVDQTVIDDVLKAADDVRARLPELTSVPCGFTVFDSLDEAMQKHFLEYGKHTR